jgi:hypothetical protein
MNPLKIGFGYSRAKILAEAGMRARIFWDRAQIVKLLTARIAGTFNGRNANLAGSIRRGGGRLLYECRWTEQQFV